MTGDRRKRELIDACVAYCALNDLEPIHARKEDWWLLLAVSDYSGGLSRLNDRQRRLIAGLGVSDAKGAGYQNAN